MFMAVHVQRLVVLPILSKKQTFEIFSTLETFAQLRHIFLTLRYRSKYPWGIFDKQQTPCERRLVRKPQQISNVRWHPTTNEARNLTSRPCLSAYDIGRSICLRISSSLYKWLSNEPKTFPHWNTSRQPSTVFLCSLNVWNNHSLSKVVQLCSLMDLRKNLNSIK